MNYIGMDTHCHSTELACLDWRGRIIRRWSGATTIPELRSILEEIPGRKTVTFEEGPLADWLYRKYCKLSARKNIQQSMTAVARELVGFVWAIAHEPKVLQKAS